MLNNREKVGSSGAHVLSDPRHLPTLPQKPKRLALPFGLVETNPEALDRRSTVHEHNIREIPLAEGGLGCALWDGGLVLTRWLYAEGAALVSQKRVLELGCGVGLAGIMAAHWASQVVLTDYIDETVDNARYNILLNDDDDDDDEAREDREREDEQSGADGGAEASVPQTQVLRYRRRIADRTSARLLDWDVVCQTSLAEDEEAVRAANALPLCTAAAGCVAPPSSSSPHHEDSTTTAEAAIREDVKLGTAPPRAVPLVVQPWFHCKTCWPSDASAGVCAACCRCHEGHELVPQPPERFACDCKKGVATSSCATFRGCLAQPVPPALVTPFDVILGAELTYNLLSCATLAAVVDKYLSPDGVFIEVLSDDRDGVTVFIEEIEKRGFVTQREAVKKEYVGKFGTRQWSKQNQETYSLYQWRRKRPQ